MKKQNPSQQGQNLHRPASTSSDPRGRLDIAAMRLYERYASPGIDAAVGVPGLGEYVKPLAEFVIAELLPGKSIFPAPRRRIA